ncbi:GDSL-type esterase/lipase family protein [Halogeometricum luteum]|uniref:GDSL-type esterase/lipase family protein n=1 Tax=Halogeometricum luteum TaxID=2950537 RepID=A0ABU2G660_9EURY|nr:GDSL-type esterase/lipase family protein [Halogeometricum sp. S3BR5-2]MDS0295643.1 GDSL-type esterase/lipase family protein [Halogeometricum sp. S3BR5-2]
MQLEAYPSVSLHNVAETVPAEWTDGGDRLCRVPAEVGAGLNETARERVRHPTGSELRFVPEGDEAEIELTLSAAERSRVRVFWGPFQPWNPTEIGPEPTTLALSVPARVGELTTEVTGRFDPRVCRIRFERFDAVAVHDVSGACRPPADDELPEERYLAYGTSITEGAASSAGHANYVSHVARNRGYDALNLGCSGSAYCEPAMAEHIAARDDWDVATLSLSVNMANTGGFPVEEFEARVEPFVNTVAAAHPDKPVACVTLFPYFDDVTASGDAEHAAAYRETLRTVVTDSPHGNLSLVEGPDLLPLSGLSADLLHPGDEGMRAIGEGLSRHLRRVTA